MKRGILIALLSFGTLAGFGWGAKSLHHHRHHRHHLEQRVARICVEAAQQVCQPPADGTRPSASNGSPNDVE